MKLYVAGPMSGWPDYNYPAFNAADEMLRDVGFEVINPCMPAGAPAPDRAQPWDWYIRRSLRLMLDADAIALLAGWESSRGARLERRIADELGMPTASMLDWISAARMSAYAAELGSPLEDWQMTVLARFPSVHI